MENEQNQEFKSSGLLAILGLVGFSMAIIATPWNRQIQDSRSEVALQKAEVVGYQVVQIYREASKNTPVAEPSGRFPASVAENQGEQVLKDMRSTGTMGMDPWGQPYRFRILSEDKVGKIRILVWSSGPNSKVETPELDNEEKILSEQPQYKGDDLGVLLSVNKN